MFRGSVWDLPLSLFATSNGVWPRVGSCSLCFVTSTQSQRLAALAVASYVCTEILTITNYSSTV